MLQSLYVENVAVIEKLSLELERGFLALTGETGAGKSILIDALNMVLGQRTSRDLIRTGAARASVTAVFAGLPEQTLAALLELGVEPDEDGLIVVSRDLGADGRGASRVGGRPTTAAVLREAAALLVNIHGQHDNQLLLAPERHINFLDAFAGHETLLAGARRLYGELGAARRELEALRRDDSDKLKRLDLLRYEIDEIEQADIYVGEQDELLEAREIARNDELIRGSLDDAYEALYGAEEGTVGELMSDAVKALGAAGEYLPGAEALHERLQDISYQLDDIVSELRDTIYSLGDEAQPIDDVESRLDTIYRLERKYGRGEQAILDYLENARAQAEAIETADERAGQLEREVERLTSDMQEAADKLSASRQAAARELEQAITGQLQFLEMPKVRFETALTSLPEGEFNANGRDVAEFLISTNPGETPRPLSKIASGGELSRIMLALKTVMTGDGVDTLIFDEVDSGVSGRAAEKIGLKLREIANGRQVLCVTHLAQIAALADEHYLIEKAVRDDGRTHTTVRSLDFDGRRGELARIMSGAEIGEHALRSAEEMLRKAR